MHCRVLAFFGNTLLARGGGKKKKDHITENVLYSAALFLKLQKSWCPMVELWPPMMWPGTNTILVHGNVLQIKWETIFHRGNTNDAVVSVPQRKWPKN